VNGLDAVKAGGLLLLSAIVQVSILGWIEVAEGRPDLVLVMLVALSLLRGPLFGAVAGFGVGFVLDVATFEPLGLTSLLLTITGYWAGRFGDVTSRSSAHPPQIAVALATLGVAFGSAILHFMLGFSISASEFFLGVLLPTLALNVLLAYPVYGLCRRLLPPERRPSREREVSPAV
jgi:rod shape-determining protein MreD